MADGSDNRSQAEVVCNKPHNITKRIRRIYKKTNKRLSVCLRETLCVRERERETICVSE